MWSVNACSVGNETAVSKPVSICPAGIESEAGASAGSAGAVPMVSEFSGLLVAMRRYASAEASAFRLYSTAVTYSWAPSSIN